MQRMIALWLIAVTMIFCGAKASQGQDQGQNANETKASKAPSQESKSPSEQHLKNVQPYRLDFALNELEDGKRTNSRHYAMNLTSGSADAIKIGTRVPVPTSAEGNSTFQYMDVGTDIWANLRETMNDVQLEVRSEISNLDVSAGREHSNLPPVVRSIKINGTTLLVTGKPMLIGSVDDPNSNRQFQLEVTATRLR